MSEAEHLTRVALDARSAYWTALGDPARAAAAPSEDSLAAWRYAAAVAATLHEAPPPADRDPRDGHEWHVVVYARGASFEAGADYFAEYVDGPMALTVQATSLPAALRAAAAAPFVDWWSHRRDEAADDAAEAGPG